MSISRGQNNLVLVGGKLATSQRSSDEVIDFICNHLVGYRISSIKYHYYNFCNHIKEIFRTGQLVTFSIEGRLVGVCCWVFINEMKDMNKIRWEFNEDITKGKTLYVSIAVLTEGANTIKVKAYLESIGTRARIDRVCWTNSIKKTLFYKGVKK